MSEQTSPQNQELASQPHVVTHEKLPLDGDDRVFITTVHGESGKRTHLLLIDQDGVDTYKLRALEQNDVPVLLLPADSDTYSHDEAVFARDTLHQSARSIKTPYAPRVVEREALAFQLETKPVIDVMIRAGHTSPELRQSRLAALHDDENEVIKALDVLLEVGRLDMATYTDAATPDTRVLKNLLAEKFALHATMGSSMVESLAEKGLEDHQLNRIKDRI
jgi:hypothetical protein